MKFRPGYVKVVAHSGVQAIRQARLDTASSGENEWRSAGLRCGGLGYGSFKGAVPEPGVPVVAFAYLSFSRICLIAWKFGSSFGVGVCSLYWMTPSLSMTNAARALTAPNPIKSGSSVP